MIIVGVSVGALQGCGMFVGTAVGAAIKNVDPKAPKPQTAVSCQAWECWDGYACGTCPDAAPTSEAAKPKK